MTGFDPRLELPVATQPLPGFSDNHLSCQPRPGRAQTLAVRTPEALRQRISTTPVEAARPAGEAANLAMALYPAAAPRVRWAPGRPDPNTMTADELWAEVGEILDADIKRVY